MNAGEVFTAEPKKDEYLTFLRRMQLKHQSWSMRDICKFCIEWNEITAELLKAGGKPYEANLADAEKWRKRLKQLENKGVMKK